MRKYALLLLLLGTAVMIFIMVTTEEPLKKPAATPKGILELEFAYNIAKTTIVTTAWTPNNNIAAAKLNTYWDFLFIFFYASFLFFCCRKIARISSGSFGKAGVLFATGILCAGVLDMLENTGMLITLSGYSSAIVALVTTTCSVIKWMLVLFSVLYCFTGIIYLAGTKNIRLLFT